MGQAVSPAKPLPMPEYRRRLPHFHPQEAYLFLSWRLWGALPRQPLSRPCPTPGHAFVAADRTLHRDRWGPLWLQEPRIARLVVEAMIAGERERGFYELFAWVVMPNHVDLLILPKVAVSEITRWLKGSTARRANPLVGRTGLPFWQDESFDHWVRNPQEFDRILGYLEENPVSAELVGSMELWPWSSATWQADPEGTPPAPPALHLPSTDLKM